MHPEIKLTEKYERNGWPAVQRPDIKPPEGWSLELITSVNRVRNHQLSPDGQQLAFVWDREGLSDVYTMPAAGGWPARLSLDRGPAIYWSDETPQWSPDGQWLAFSMDNTVHVVSAAGGLPQKVSDFAPGASAPVWLPDSMGLVVSIEWQGADKLLLTDRSGSWLRALTSGPGDDAEAQSSPDGRMVVFVHRPHDDLNRLDIKVVELESGQIRPLTGQPRQKDWQPRWSPDGRLIAFLSQRSGWNEVWLVQPDGEGLRQLTRLGRDVADLAWSPDGTRLACTVNNEGAFDLALLDVQNSDVSYLRRGLGVYSRPCWSPGGDFLTVEYEDPTLPPDLYRVSVPDGQLTQLTFSNPPALARHTLVVPEQVSYRSYDGLEIPTLFYRPVRPNGAAILNPHGGPTAQSVYDWDILAQYYLAKGYTYLMPNYRGSTGYGLKFEHANYDNWGVGDTQDCLYGARYLARLDWIDPQRLAIYGGSYGGFMVACCLARDPEYLFACGVYKYGDAHLVASWAQCNRSTRLYTEMQVGHPARNRQVYLDASPIFQVEHIQKPVLILHGLEDTICPPEATEEWVEALRRAGKTFEYKTYAGEPHNFLKRENLLDVYRRIERFLDWYLLP
ncbi:MAG: S9 family peptidase [Anaerolineales bacterium]|nr:S9 family peptidase [Anaerolineales bacterium]